MRHSRLATLAVALAIMPMVATAEECVPLTRNPEVDVSLPNGDRYYADWDCPGINFFIGDCGVSIWVYQESNGLDGLQRWDEFSGDTACGNGDTIIF